MIPDGRGNVSLTPPLEIVNPNLEIRKTEFIEHAFGLRLAGIAGLVLSPGTAERLGGGTALFEDNIAQVHFATANEINRAWILFQQRAAAGWSFTDCTSKIVIAELPIFTTRGITTPIILSACRYSSCVNLRSKIPTVFGSRAYCMYGGTNCASNMHDPPAAL